MPRRPNTPAAFLLAVLFGMGCGVLAAFGVTFASWISIGPEACCPVNPADLMLGAALGAALVLWGRIMRRRYERNGDEVLQIRSRKRRPW